MEAIADKGGELFCPECKTSLSFETDKTTGQYFFCPKCEHEAYNSEGKRIGHVIARIYPKIVFNFGGKDESL